MHRSRAEYLIVLSTVRRRHISALHEAQNAAPRKLLQMQPDAPDLRVQAALGCMRTRPVRIEAADVHAWVSNQEHEECPGMIPHDVRQARGSDAPHVAEEVDLGVAVLQHSHGVGGQLGGIVTLDMEATGLGREPASSEACK